METERNIDISKKLVTLTLLSGTRVKTLTHLKVTNMFKPENACSFIFDVVLKHSRSNQKPLAFQAYPECRSMCTEAILLKYLQVRLPRSADPWPFITTLSPGKYQVT